MVFIFFLSIMSIINIMSIIIINLDPCLGQSQFDAWRYKIYFVNY